MGDSSHRAVRLGATVMVMCMLASFVSAASSVARALLNGQYIQIDSQISTMDLAELSRYDAVPMLGDRVLNTAAKYRDRFFIRIATERMPTGFFNRNMRDLGASAGSEFIDVKEPESAYYVDPTVSFTCTVLENEYGAGVGLLFMQDEISTVLNTAALDTAAQATVDEINLIKAQTGGD